MRSAAREKKAKKDKQFESSHVTWDDGEHFEIMDFSKEDTSKLLWAKSITLYIEFEKVEGLEEFDRRKNKLRRHDVDLDEEIKSFVRNWMTLRSYKPKRTRMAVPWVGSFDGEWNDGTCWAGKTDPRGEARVKFFQTMTVSDHFGHQSFRVAGEQMSLYLGNATLEYASGGKPTNLTASDIAKYFWIIDSGTEVHIEPVIRQSDEEADAGVDRFNRITVARSGDEQLIANAVEAQVHRGLLFLLMYSIAAGKVNCVYVLEPRAVEKAREMMLRKFQGSEHLINAICKEFWELTRINPADEYSVGRGFLFHGPPGTGKTTLIGFLAELVGMTLITPLIPASSLRRGLVGETEHIIMQLAMRAAYQPWNLCVLSLDEIETLVKKRPTDGAKDGDSSSLNTVLAIIEGGSNVQNLHMFGSTNMGHAIDDAFQRRMLDGIFFVGLMNVKARREMIAMKFQPLPGDDPTVVSRRGNARAKLYFAGREVLDFFVAITMNLGGSHLKAILSRIQSAAEDLYEISQDKAAYEVTREICLEHTRRVCATQNIRLGDSYLCDYFQVADVPIGTADLCRLPQHPGLVQNPDYLRLTGRMIVNLGDQPASLFQEDVGELLDEASGQEDAFKYVLPRGNLFMEATCNRVGWSPKLLEAFDCSVQTRYGDVRSPTISDVIVMATQFCVHNHVDVFKVFNGAWLKQHNLNDEKEAGTKLSEEMFSIREYKSVLVLFDVDSLIVSEYITKDFETSEFEQVPLWKSLLHQVIEIARSANVYVPPPSVQGEDQTGLSGLLKRYRGGEHGGDDAEWRFSRENVPPSLWVVFVTRSPALLSAYQNALHFPRSKEELVNFELAKLKKQTQTCSRCGERFTLLEEQEEDNYCQWHSGDLIYRGKGTGAHRSLKLRSRAEASASLQSMAPQEVQDYHWQCCGAAASSLTCQYQQHQPHVRQFDYRDKKEALLRDLGAKVKSVLDCAKDLEAKDKRFARKPRESGARTAGDTARSSKPAPSPSPGGANNPAPRPPPPLPSQDNPPVASVDEYAAFHDIPLRLYERCPSWNRFQSVPQRGDGDCFFHSLAFLLNMRDDPTYFRTAVADEVAANKLFYSGFIDGDIDDYIRGIRGAEWGDQVELRAVERLYRRPVIVYDEQGRLQHRGISRDTDVQSNPEPLYFLFVRQGHYDALIKRTDSSYFSAPPAPPSNQREKPSSKTQSKSGQKGYRIDPDL